MTFFSIQIIIFPISNPEICYLLGLKYHPLRKEFWEVPKKEIREKIEKVLITFGGSDMTNETPEVLDVLKDHFPNLEKHVIIGSGFTNINVIKDAADDKTILIIQPGAEKMKQEMLECDIAISAAGQTVFELSRIGIPSIVMKIADNQEKNISSWLSKGCIIRIDELGELKIAIIGCNYNSRLLYSGNMVSTMEGNGCEVIYKLLTNDL